MVAGALLPPYGGLTANVSAPYMAAACTPREHARTYIRTVPYIKHPKGSIDQSFNYDLYAQPRPRLVRANDWIAVCALLVHMTRHGARRLDVNQGVASYLVMLIASVVCLDSSA
ncbi:hypothetical protein ALC60_00796 [Trachymyrmex zeteki]|uniref:Uncharacterized protein n=1 Tax=Mycetomoellerius zeteki TaxID=64791 RepID=A0A151XJD4_9HYME|nr:hypothetical protein ALC60_00796 [Trachymyrmex zeteki]